MKRYKIYVLIVLILSSLLICEIKYDNTRSLESVNINTLDNVSTKYSDSLIAFNNSNTKANSSVITNTYEIVSFDSLEVPEEVIELDTENPVINYKKKIYSTVGKKVNLLKKVTVTDNSGEVITATIEGNYDFNKAGTYKLKYVAKDSSNNITEEEFKLIVQEPAPVVETPVVEATNVPVVVGTMRQKMVAIARSQLGNVGGQPYWSWYGFSGRVEWCATFVSWVANQAGVLNAHIPKFAGVGQGSRYFKSKGQWRNKNYIPSPGDIIFFDYNYDGRNDHVGIVEKVDGGKVYTIEGNSTNACKNRSYPVGGKMIYGYGVPSYQ